MSMAGGAFSKYYLMCSRLYDEIELGQSDYDSSDIADNSICHLHVEDK